MKLPPLRHFASFLALLALVAVLACTAGANDSCVGCHKNVKSDSMAGHSFADWEKSIHQKMGISCNACHGGNPSATDKKESHQGLQISTDKNSLLYFTHIPETCGQCHSDILKQFKKSAHYSELKSSGRGPNCLTCHGSMATWVLKPDQMEQTCTLCHNKPMQAQATLMSLGVAQSTIHKLSSMTPPDQTQAEVFKALTTDLESTIQLWHSFDMPKVLEQSRRLIKQVRDMSTDWELRSKKKTGEKK